MNVRILRLCGFFGMLTPVVGFIMVFLAISQAPWFSWTLNALSDLGVDGFEAVLFNSGLPLTGAVMMMFSAGQFNNSLCLLGAPNLLILEWENQRSVPPNYYSKT